MRNSSANPSEAGRGGSTKFFTVMLVLFLAALFLMTSSCRVTVEPGHEKVFNAKPLLFLWTGGVSPEPLREGSTFIAPTTSAIDVDMLPTSINRLLKILEDR